MIDFKQIAGHESTLSGIAGMLLTLERSNVEVSEVKVEANGEKGGFNYTAQVVEK